MRFCGYVRNISVVHDLEVLQIFQIGPPPTLHFSYKVEQFLPVLDLHFFSAQMISHSYISDKHGIYNDGVNDITNITVFSLDQQQTPVQT